MVKIDVAEVDKSRSLVCSMDQTLRILDPTILLMPLNRIFH